MGTLRVFNSEGRPMHPVGADTSAARYSNYFGNVHFKADFGDQSYIECYARVHTERRKEQVYIRYDGDRSVDLFAGCRSSVQEELVEGRGWRFADRSQVDPSKLFLSLILDPDELTIPSVAGTPLAEHESAVEAVLEGGEEQLEIHGRNFAVLAGLVKKYSNVDCSVVVVDRPKVNASADLVLAKASLIEEFSVREGTEKAIARYVQQRARERRQEQFSRIEDALSELARENTNPDTVATELRNRLSRHFREVRVSGPQTSRQRRTRTSAQSDEAVRTDGFSEYDADDEFPDDGSEVDGSTRSSSGTSLKERLARGVAWAQCHSKWLLVGVLIAIAGLVLIGFANGFDSVWRMLERLPIPLDATVGGGLGIRVAATGAVTGFGGDLASTPSVER
jgi:hypothetical protein